MWICISRNIAFVVEQPESSLLDFHPRWIQFERAHKMFKKIFAQRDYGGASKKPIVFVYLVAQVNHNVVFMFIRFLLHSGFGVVIWSC